jgi:Flp pilus assembly protein TadG
MPRKVRREPTASPNGNAPRKFCRPGRRDVQLGVATTELAVAALLLVPIMSGVIDGGYYMQATRMNADAARAGGREGVRACVGSINCTTSNPTNADTRIVTAAAAFYGAKSPNIRKVIVYKAATDTDTVPGTCVESTVGGVAGLCNVYVNPVLADGSVSMIAGSAWPAGARTRTISVADYLGTYIEYMHPSPVGLVMPRKLTVTSRAVFRLEPPVIAASAVPDLPVFAQAAFPWTWQDYSAPCVINCSVGSPTNPGNGSG